MMSNWGPLALVLVPLLLQLRVAADCFADMTPDHDLLVGSTLVINCSLPNKNYEFKGTNYFINSSNLRFKFNQQYIAEDFIEYVDEFTARLTVHNTTIHNSGPYYCFIKVPEVPHPLLGCLNNVSVGYPPQPAKNFSCISFNYQNLTCSWVIPYNPIRTSYNLFVFPYQIMGFPNLRQECGDKLSESSCQWRLNTSPPYRKAPVNLNFILVANNSQGSYQEKITREHFKLVLPRAPNRFKYLNIGKESLALTWEPPEGMDIPGDFEPGLLYQLHWSSGVLETLELHYNLTGLFPNTQYSFRIRCKSTVADDPAMWSPFSTILITTLPDVPYLAPKMRPEVFEVIKDAGTQTVFVYWKPLDKSDENGDNFHYLAWYNELGSDIPLGYANTTSTIVAFKHLSLEKNYSFHVMAANIKGNGTEVESINIGSERPPVAKSLIVVARGNGSYDISWQEPSELTYKIEAYTVVWCRALNPRPYRCAGPIEWQQLSFTDRSIQLNLANDHLNSYHFGLSLIDEKGSSGLLWASCMVPLNGVLPKLREITLEPKNATSLRIKWRMDCEAQKQLVKSYQILYCKVQANNKECLDNATTLELYNLDSMFYLTHLKPYTYYKVKFTPKIVTGQMQDSDPLWERTLSAAPSDPPQDISVIPINPDSMHVSWRPPQQPNGVISHYEVFYGPSHLLVKDRLSVDLVGLQYFTNYSIQVAACVDRACSPLSATQSLVSGVGVPGTMDAPRIEIMNVSSWEIKVSWLPPSVSNGPIDLYVLEYGGDNGTTMNVTLLGTTVSTTMLINCRFLESNDKYLFRIRAVNYLEAEEALGPWSETTITSLCYNTKHGFATWAIVLIILSFLLAFAFAVSISTYITKFSDDKLNPIETAIELPNTLEENAVVLKFISYFKNKSSANHNQNADTDGDNKERHESGTSHHSTEKLLNIRPENIEMIPTSSPENKMMDNNHLVNIISLTKDNDSKVPDKPVDLDAVAEHQNLQNYAKVSQDEGYQPFCVLNPNLIHCIIDPSLKQSDSFNLQDMVEPGAGRKDSLELDKSPPYISSLPPHNDTFALDSKGNLVPNSLPINNYVPFIPFKPNLTGSQESVRATECELLLQTENQEPPSTKPVAVLSPSYIVSSLLNPPVEPSSNNNVVKPVVWL